MKLYYYMIASDEALYILISFIIIFLTVGLIYLLFRSVKKEVKGNSEIGDEFFNEVKGLKSKSQLMKDVKQYIDINPNPELTLIYIDLDNFKGINDAFGQHQGDMVLKTIATNLVKSLPRFATICNFSGDDFIIFIRGDFPNERLEAYLNELQSTISKPIPVFNDEVTITGSFGVVQAPYNGKHLQVLMTNLEISMYVSKKEGKHRYTIFNPSLSEKEQDNLNYYQQVKRAISKSEFVMYYQPIINFKTGEIAALEGLIRWNHPELGVVPPAKFLNILEQTGDINWIGQWGFETIVKASIEWKKTFPSSKVIFSFNLSPKQLLSPTIVDDLKKTLRKYKDDSSSFSLEVVEFAMFERFGIIKNNIIGLKNLGFKMAIDDFGLDYSTFTRLETFNFDIIKLDRKFSETVKDSFITEKIANMLSEYAVKENKMVIAENVEDIEMVELLKKNGIYFGQGYYFLPPKPLHEVIDLNQKNTFEKLVKK